MREIRLALPDDVPTERWRRFVVDQHWASATQDDDDDAGDDEQEAWLASDDTVIRLVHDDALELRRLSVTGPRAVPAADAVRVALGAVGAEDAATRFAASSAPAERARALYLLAATAPEQPTASAGEAVREGLRDPDRDVRLAAAAVAVYAPWPELASLLATIAKDDPDAGVRATAGNAVIIIDAQR